MASKIILCRCEDVTLADVRHAVASGFADLEEVKRYTGFGTGPCQGKECLRAVALAIAEASARPVAAMQPFTTRPPLVPTELKLFAASRAASGAGPAKNPAPEESPRNRSHPMNPLPLAGEGLGEGNPCQAQASAKKVRQHDP